MNRNRLVLTVYSRTYKAANDDGLSSAVFSPQKSRNDSEVQPASGWDPFEVWRTRVRPALKRESRER